MKKKCVSSSPVNAAYAPVVNTSDTALTAPAPSRFRARTLNRYPVDAFSPVAVTTGLAVPPRDTNVDSHGARLESRKCDAPASTETGNHVLASADVPCACC